MSRWTDALAKSRGLKVKKESRFTPAPTAIAGHNFPSKFHAAVYQEIKFMMLGGDYENLRCEVRLHVCGNLYWRADFVVFNKRRGVDEAHEAKGHREDRRFHTIRQAWIGHGPMDMVIWKGDHKRPFIWKTIRGKIEEGKNG